VFTGLIEETGTIGKIEAAGEGKYLTVLSKTVLDGTKIGDSISVDGVCLTVTSLSRDSFTAFASQVTCSLTTIGRARAGTRVNLERALSLGSRMGGHIVQGHADGMGTIREIERDANGIRIRIALSDSLLRQVVPKGSVAVDGISLTIVSLERDGMVLYLIPETMSNTTLGGKNIGDYVNIETDVLAKYIERFMQGRNEAERGNDEGLMKKLAEGGFI
jgi:riboflavin synthase